MCVGKSFNRWTDANSDLSYDVGNLSSCLFIVCLCSQYMPAPKIKGEKLLRKPWEWIKIGGKVVTEVEWTLEAMLKQIGKSWRLKENFHEKLLIF